MHNKIFHIPADLSFLDELARGLYEKFGDFSPLDFSKIIILLPSKRACRSLKEILLKSQKKDAVLLPDIRPLGEAYEEIFSPENPGKLELYPVSPIQRKLLLTQIIAGWKSAAFGKERGLPENNFAGFFLNDSAYLADHLASFLDEMQREKIPLEKLNDIVPVELAGHWQVTLDFFSLLGKEWPAILEKKGLIDIAEYTNRMLQHQANIWRAGPPEFPVIIAGSTGSIPATADLIKCVAELPGGYIVLPGLDKIADDIYWRNIEEIHPQSGLKKLLESLKVKRGEVESWTAGESNSARLKFSSEVMRPAATIAKWLSIEKMPETVLHGIERIDCHNQQEEAVVIAMRLREVLEKPGAKAALVTTDRSLARRVSSVMQKWGVELGDSAGIPLLELPEAVYLRQSALAVNSNFAPVDLLALLKNPFTGFGLIREEYRAMIGKLEQVALRGIRDYQDLPSLKELLEVKNEPELVGFIVKLEEISGGFAAAMRLAENDFGSVLKAHIDFAEKLAAEPDASGVNRLWRSDTGAKIHEFLQKLIEISSVLSHIDPSLSYLGLLEAFLATGYYHAEIERHPRIFILGPLEARLHQFDLVIIGEMNEGKWPVSGNNPWMSKSMREQVGLYSEEKRKSLSAHDFYNFISAKNVLITRAEKDSGEVTMPSNLLFRTETFLRAMKVPGGIAPRKPWLEWAQALYEPHEKMEIAAPAPSPPAATRPRKFSVSGIEMLLRNPYRFYASHILKLRPLEDIDQDPEKAELGKIVHDAMFIFGRDYREGNYSDIYGQIIKAGKTAFMKIRSKAAHNLWWPKFCGLAGNLALMEIERRKAAVEMYFEINGEIDFSSANGQFTLTARADRVEITRDGDVIIIDYKTGALPAKSEIEQGLSPQLFLEGLILREGGFDKLMLALGGKNAKLLAIRELEYWKFFSGNEIIVQELGAGEEQINKAAQKLKETADKYAGSASSYESTPWLDKGARYDPYRHLARIGEWLYF